MSEIDEHGRRKLLLGFLYHATGGGYWSVPERKEVILDAVVNGTIQFVTDKESRYNTHPVHRILTDELIETTLWRVYSEIIGKNSGKLLPRLNQAIEDLVRPNFDYNRDLTELYEHWHGHWGLEGICPIFAQRTFGLNQAIEYPGYDPLTQSRYLVLGVEERKQAASIGKLMKPYLDKAYEIYEKHTIKV